MVQSLVDYIEAAADRFPDRTAIVDPQGWSVTYAQLNAQSNAIAGFLIDAGVQPGDRVGVVGAKGVAPIVAFLGIMKARAAYVPTDYSAPPERNRTILSDCQVKLAFLDPACSLVLDSWPTDSPPMVVWLAEDDVIRDARPGTTFADALGHAPARASGRRRDDLAYILYTSGSTGIPKGVMLSHENALSFVDWCSEVLTPSEADRFSSHAPFHFDLSILDIYVPLKHGATLYVVSEELGKTPKELAAFIATHRLTVWYSTPSILTLLSEYGNLPSHDYSQLRFVLFAGEVFPVKHLRRIAELLPHAEYYNLYGPTETNVCTFARIPVPVPADRTIPYPIGWPCSHCEARMFDDDRRPVANSDEGLLYIAGWSVFQGYWNRPEQNARAFIEYDGRRWYNTGDVVRLDPKEGFIYQGRRDRMVKRRGYRIELGEIERGLYQHASIAEAAVVSVPDDSSGVRIMAFVSAKNGPRPSIIDMKTFCGSRLPSYMNPDAFIFLETLPRTSTDKVDYQTLTRVARGDAATPRFAK